MASVRDIEIKIDTQLIDTIGDAKVLIERKNLLLQRIREYMMLYCPQQFILIQDISDEMFEELKLSEFNN